MGSPTSIGYAGSELALFAEAIQWKAYWAACVRPFVDGRVLEVGAGMAGSTEALCGGSETEWHCLEPDPILAGTIERRIEEGALPAKCRALRGVVADLPGDPAWDTILYIDVLEHIEDDRGELREAAGRLAAGGHLVVLAPAHGWLYSRFDAAIGHHRRYTKGSLSGIVPAELEACRLLYLDSLGMLLSLANRLLLRSAEPTRSQIAFWDRRVVPASRRIDPLLGYRLGKTIVGVWRRAAGARGEG